MNKFYFLFILLLLTLEVVASSPHENDVAQAREESIGMSATELEKINDIILRRIKNGDIPGAVVAISRKGERVFVSSQGLMDPQKKIPMRRDAMFVMQSSSKPVAGVATMIAMEQGLFDLQDKVYKYIPKFKDIQVSVLKGSNVSPNYVWATKKTNLTIFGAPLEG